MSNCDAGIYLKSVSSPNISLEEERRLFAVIKSEDSPEIDKDDAIESICRSHIRFVSQMANYYCKRCPVEKEDMIGVGVVGMMTAIEKFELKFNCKFTTYCGWWIKLEMIKHIQHSCPVTIPSSVHDGLIKIQAAMRDSEEDLSREDLKDKLNFTEEKMAKLDKAKVKTISLQIQQTIGEDTSSFEDMISDDALNPYDSYEKDDLLLNLHDMLEDLDDKTREIVMSKHLDDKVKLQDMADKYGVSPERIRQIRVLETNKLKARLLEEKPI